MTTRRILIGTDGSPAAERAVRWAVMVARDLEAELRIVCCYGLPSFVSAALDGGFAAADDTAIRAGAQAVLADAAAIAQAAGVPHSTEAVAGDPAGVLIDMSDEVSAIVVGTRGGGGFSDRLLGTVSAAVPAHAKCPTVVVPYRMAGKFGGVPVPDGGEAEQMRPLESVTVGVDGSLASEMALAMAMRIAQQCHARLTVIAVVPVGINPALVAWLPAPMDEASGLPEVQAGVEKLIAKYQHEYRELEISVSVIPGSAPSALIAASGHTDLMILGSRGRGGFVGLVLGSTSQAVLHHSRCPVAILTSRSHSDLSDHSEGGQSNQSA